MLGIARELGWRRRKPLKRECVKRRSAERKLVREQADLSASSQGEFENER